MTEESRYTGEQLKSHTPMVMTSSVEGASDDAIEQRVSYAYNLYSQRNNLVDKMVRLYTQEYAQVKSAIPAPGAVAGAPDFLGMVKPAWPAAIVHKYISYMLQSARIGMEVMPLRAGERKGETNLCSKAEEYLQGVIAEANYTSSDSWTHRSAWWYYLGGMGTVKTIFDRHRMGTEKFPVIITSPDTRQIYPVRQRGDTLYVVERYQSHVMTIKSELEALRSSTKGRVKVPLFQDGEGEPLSGTDVVDVEEYWDEDTYAITVGSERVWKKKHGYPCIPYAFGYCLPSGIDSPEWAGQPILASSENAFKNISYQLSLLQRSVELFFWPYVLVQTPDGQMVTLQVNPGSVNSIDPEAKITVLNPQPAVGLLQNLYQTFTDEVSRNTLPPILWMQPRSPARSGYAEEIRFAGTEADLRYQSNRFSGMLGHAFGNILRLTEAFAGEKGFCVYAQKSGKSRTELIDMKKDDIKGHYQVRVEIQPRMPKDMLQEMQLARFARERSAVTGEQLLPDEYILREVLHVDNPALLESQRRMELARGDPRIQEWIKRQSVEDFKNQEGISKKDWDEIEAALMPQQAMPQEPPPSTLPMPPMSDQGEMGMMPGGPGSTEWGVGNEIMPAEEGGLGRAQQYGPEQLAAMAAQITGRPREE